MKGLLRFFIRHHFAILFVLLQILSFVIIDKYGSFQKAKILSSHNIVSGTILTSLDHVKEYFLLKKANHELKKINRNLIRENAMLLSTQSKNLLSYEENKELQSYRFYNNKKTPVIPGKVINNSINSRHNYLTINRGSRHGVTRDMGVISRNGVVGIILDVSKNYSVAISILNEKLSVSAKIKKEDYFGSLSWNGRKYYQVSLNEIPFHVDLSKGDTVVTSGFSSIFPDGITIGTISEFLPPKGDNFYSITVDLSVDFKNLMYVDILANTDREEILNLESQVQ